jgi:hypothetical protein
MQRSNSRASLEDRAGMIETDLPSRVRLRVDADVNENALRLISPAKPPWSNGRRRKAPAIFLARKYLARATSIRKPTTASFPQNR